jgi:hypothetical protein
MAISDVSVAGRTFAAGVWVIASAVRYVAVGI